MNSLEDTVHIIPLGHEFDRAVIPFNKKNPDRVYLLSISQDHDYPEDMKQLQQEFTRRVREQIESQGIDVRIVYIDAFNLLEVMKAISSLILLEQQKNNNIFVNMSACGRLTSVGASLAAMCHNAKLYYVSADRYSSTTAEVLKHGLSICEQEKILSLENFHIEIPESPGVDILVHLYNQDKDLSHEEIVFFCIDQQFDGYKVDYREFGKFEEKRKKLQSNYLMKIDKNVLARLERSRYIKRKKIGNKRMVSITNTGVYVVCISGRLPINVEM